jgi:hypothetical protein
MIGSVSPPLALTAFLAVYAPTLQKGFPAWHHRPADHRDLSAGVKDAHGPVAQRAARLIILVGHRFRWDHRQSNCRPDHPMEFSTHDGGMETSARAGGGMRDRAQARRSDSALHSAVRRLNLLSFLQNRSSR